MYRERSLKKQEDKMEVFVQKINFQDSKNFKIVGKKIEEIGEREDYEWIKEVGKGTFGTVHKVKHKKSSNIYAIKQINLNLSEKTTELEILKKLDHKNCIKIFNYFYSKEGPKVNQRIYLNIVMEYFKNDLYGIIRYYRKKQIDFPNPLGKIYSYQLLRAIAYTHNLGYVHRDIKPQNILVNQENHRIVLCDYGSAKYMNLGEKSLTYICSRFYRAPEMILGCPKYGKSVDIWSLGCVIAEMYLGCPLFLGKNSKDMIEKIVDFLGTPSEEEINALRKDNKYEFPQKEKKDFESFFRKGTDPQLFDLLKKMLLYDPRERIKPLDALLHPFFDELREDNLTINGRKLVDLFDFGSVEIGIECHLLKELIPKWWFFENKEGIHKSKSN